MYLFFELVASFSIHSAIVYNVIESTIHISSVAAAIPERNCKVKHIYTQDEYSLVLST